jgi:hypothetical protein
MGIEQKVAVITAAPRGIGAAFVRAYHDRKLPDGRCTSIYFRGSLMEFMTKDDYRP